MLQQLRHLQPLRVRRHIAERQLESLPNNGQAKGLQTIATANAADVSFEHIGCFNAGRPQAFVR